MNKRRQRATCRSPAVGSISDVLLCDLVVSGREDWSEGGSRFRVDHGFELTQAIHVFIRVVLAEEQLSTCGQYGTNSCGGTAAVATIDRGQWGACQGYWHDSSVLAPGTTVRSPGVGPVVTPRARYRYFPAVV